MSIEFKEGAVCYADGKQLIYNEWEFDSNTLLSHIVSLVDFQLNEPREGYFTPKSELDTEEKYNQAVEVFGLLGHVFGDGALNCYPDLDKYGNLTICHDGIYCTELTPKWCKVKLTFDQLMAIGKLKRKMNKQGSVSKVNRDIERVVKSTINDELDKQLKVSANKYEREITDRQGSTAIVDVYDVLKAFEVTCPATQHAVKKLLCSGIRGYKDLGTDLTEARDSITRAVELNG